MQKENIWIPTFFQGETIRKRTKQITVKKEMKKRSEIVPKGNILNRRNVCPEKNSSKQEKSLFLKEQC